MEVELRQAVEAYDNMETEIQYQAGYDCDYLYYSALIVAKPLKPHNSGKNKGSK